MAKANGNKLTNYKYSENSVTFYPFGRLLNKLHRSESLTEFDMIFLILTICVLIALTVKKALIKRI